MRQKYPCLVGIKAGQEACSNKPLHFQRKNLALETDKRTEQWAKSKRVNKKPKQALQVKNRWNVGSAFSEDLSMLGKCWDGENRGMKCGECVFTCMVYYILLHVLGVLNTQLFFANFAVNIAWNGFRRTVDFSSNYHSSNCFLSHLSVCFRLPGGCSGLVCGWEYLHHEHLHCHNPHLDHSSMCWQASRTDH